MIICYTVPEIWYMTCNYFSFWTIFYPFTTLTAQKNQNFKKMKENAWRYHHFTHVYQKIMIR